VDLGDTDVVLEANSEILAKKLLYRANGFKARDVLDISAALAMDRPSAIAALNATAGTRPALLRRLAAMTAVPESELVRDIAITHAGRRHAADMVPRLLLAIAETDNSGMGQQPTRRATRREPDNRMDSEKDRANCSGVIALRHAVENASDEPIADDGIIAIPRGAGGTGSHLRAIFGDASLQVLARAGASRGATQTSARSRFSIGFPIPLPKCRRGSRKRISRPSPASRAGPSKSPRAATGNSPLSFARSQNTRQIGTMLQSTPNGPPKPVAGP
jgi:hypothetical protein